MNNKTTVRLMVRSEDFKKHQELFFGANDQHEYEGFVILVYFDVLYGCLNFELSLQESNIPYDKSWGNGVMFIHGCEYCRILPSGCVYVCEDLGMSEIMVDKIMSKTNEIGTSGFNDNEGKEDPIIGWSTQEEILKEIRLNK